MESLGTLLQRPQDRARVVGMSAFQVLGIVLAVVCIAGIVSGYF